MITLDNLKTMLSNIILIDVTWHKKIGSYVLTISIDSFRNCLDFVPNNGSWFQIAKITEEGFTVSEPYSLKTFWDFNAFKNPTLGAEGSW